MIRTVALRSLLPALVVTASLSGLLVLMEGCKKQTAKDTIIQAGDDPRLAAAAAEARKRWPEFIKEFNKSEPNVAYAVKVSFPVRGGGSEHMWISVTAIDGTTIRGVLDSEPVNDVGLKRGDAATTTIDQIEDWMVGRGKGNLKGLFSVPVLQAIEAERKANRDK